MSQEWLKKLAELSNDKDLMKRAQQLEQQQRAPQQRAVARQAAGRRSLFGAAFGFFFRFLFLFALAEAAAMFVVAQLDGLANEPWGLILHHTLWYPLTQPIFPAEIYELLGEWFGLTQAGLSAFYERIAPDIEEYQDVLVFALPAVASLALTLLFLPLINANRRGSPIRVIVFIANWAVVVLFSRFGWGILGLWFMALLFSFAGGRIPRAPRETRAQPAAQPNRPARPAPAVRATSAIPSVPGTRAASVSPVNRAARSSVGLRREPTVSRRSDSGSWIRGR